MKQRVMRRSRQFNGYCFKINERVFDEWLGIGWISVFFFREENDLYRGRIDFYCKRFCLNEPLTIYDIQITYEDCNIKSSCKDDSLSYSALTLFKVIAKDELFIDINDSIFLYKKSLKKAYS